MKNCFIIGVLLLFTFTFCNKKQGKPTGPPEPATAFQINERLGRGINIGDTYETDINWKRPFDPDYFRIIAGLGFKHVRLPIRWNRTDRSLNTPPYTIQPDFLQTIKAAVDAALKNKLHIIINVHHDDALASDPAGQKERFLSQWQQISDYFKSYPDSLLFEVLNEPHDQITAEVWNDLFHAAVAEIRKTNPTRCILIGTAEWGGMAAINKLILPHDKHLIFTVHYYNPFHFTHQGASWVQGSDAWLGTKWYDTKYERQAVKDESGHVITFAKNNNIPIHIGEFGAYSKADMDSRIRWTLFLARWFEEQKFSWAYWEFNSGFGIYDPITKQLREPLVNALTKDAMPPALDPPLITIYTSDFSTGQKDGWMLHNNDASASSSMSVSGGKININITQPGNETWYIQLIHGGFNIEKGKMYRVSFKASSDNSKRTNVYMAKAVNPWTLYGDSNVFNVNNTETNFSFVFTAAQSDSNANLVFSIGKSGTGGFSISNIVLQELVL